MKKNGSSAKSSHLVIVILCALMALVSCTNSVQSKIDEMAEADQLTTTTKQIEKALPVRQDIVKGVLDNGLSYFIRDNKTPENFAELRLVVKAGSLQEDISQLGFAHFAEHMAFNGTADFEKQEIVEFVESIGMRFGAHLNAYTSFDETVYQLRIPTDTPGNIETGIHILENWAHKISFDPQAIDDERGVVLEEWRGRKGASERIFEQSLPITLGGSDYPNRMPIGDKDIIIHGSHTDLRRFYDTWYRSDLMSVIAVGDFGDTDVEALITQYFGQLIKPTNKVLKPKQTLTKYDVPQFSLVTDPDLTSSGFSISWRLPEFVPKTEADLRDATINRLLLNALNNRFSEKSWQPSSPYTNARSAFSRQYNLGSQFSVGVGVKPDKFSEAFTDVLEELKRAQQYGITQAELDQQKRIYIEGLKEGITKQDTLSHNAYVGQFMRHFLQGQTIASLQQRFAIIQSYIDDLTAADLQARLHEWMALDDVMISANAPENDSEKLLSEAEFMALWEQAKTLQTEAYAPQAEVSKLMTTLPSPGSILNKSYIDKWDTHVWTLSNGIKVHLKQTDFKDNEIRFWALSPGGYSLVTDEQYLSSFAMMTSLPSMGLGELDTEQYNNYRRGKRFSLSTSIGGYSEQAYGSSTQKELEDFMQTLHLRFTAPRKDQERFDWIKGLYRPQIEKRFNNPQALFYSKIRQALNNPDKRDTEFDIPALERQNLDTIFDIRKSSFANAGDFNYVFVGDMDFVQMERMLSTYVATLPTSDKNDEALIRPDIDIEGMTEVHLQKGFEPKATVIMRIWGEAQWSHLNNLAYGALKSGLENRLRNRLREELGAVYSVGVSGNFKRWPHQENSIAVSFTCDPERIEELRGEVEQVFNEFIDGNIEPSIVENYKTRLLTQRAKALKENSFWQAHIMNSMTQFTPTPIDEYETLVNSLTIDIVKAAAKEYLSREDGYYATLTPQPAKADEPKLKSLP
ncbi:MAG: zinc protease [Glaciecola sp.]|jgi:zinc protease